MPSCARIRWRGCPARTATARRRSRAGCAAHAVRAGARRGASAGLPRRRTPARRAARRRASRGTSRGTSRATRDGERRPARRRGAPRRPRSRSARRRRRGAAGWRDTRQLEVAPLERRVEHLQQPLLRQHRRPDEAEHGERRQREHLGAREPPGANEQHERRSAGAPGSAGCCRWTATPASHAAAASASPVPSRDRKRRAAIGPV
jgi:hypothetical protein